MSHAPSSPDLPPAPTLSRAAQLRWLLIGSAAAGVVLVVIVAIHLLTPAAVPAAPVATPPGSFRPTASQMAQLRTVSVGTGADPASIVATGTISVDEDHSTPVVLPYSGQVGEIFVQAGQHVTKGQPILQIASGDFVDARNALFAANAQRAAAAAQFKTAQDNATRQAAIYQSAGGALKDYRQAESDLVTAQSAMRTADSALGAARDKLTLLGKSGPEIDRLEKAGEVAGIYAQTTFHAPSSGVIVARNVAPGQYISSGGDKPVIVIADMAHVWLVAQVDQSDAAKVHLGDRIEVTTPAYPGHVFHAVIDNVGAALDPDTHRLPVRATVANENEALKPDMFASFSIQRGTGQSAILIPAEAVIHEGDSARVWVAGADGLLRARTVTISDSANGMVKVSSGLNPGERIVTSGAIFVNEAGLGS
ncbi:efflux RND transporter periplasmic adaptor subunit [Sphingomonas abietis]|uniref:Efflux RND transporter periplasmic adaptor subunit n=1 Tax=Sphingomonas abietis TaxID=3012344 RepID=A0ABY7NPJ1_9SPHN|nr:efflux RND transporter periplasmic adaptor subunit [Sphingomonas abietis]WBO21396.1 efflux RND transporter periplasmic adaptor subunit [Sphingomonas abietis]